MESNSNLTADHNPATCWWCQEKSKIERSRAINPFGRTPFDGGRVNGHCYEDGSTCVTVQMPIVGHESEIIVALKHGAQVIIYGHPRRSPWNHGKSLGRVFTDCFGSGSV